MRTTEREGLKWTTHNKSARGILTPYFWPRPSNGDMAQGGLKKKSSKFALPSKTRPKGTKTISKKPVGPKRGRKNSSLLFTAFIVKQLYST